MTVNNRKKSLKQINGLSKAHPYSRKSVQMKRVLQRNFKLNENFLKKEKEKNLKIDKYLWFKNYIADLPVEKFPFDQEKMFEMIMAYINRNDFLIQELESTARPGRPKNPKLILLQSLKANDLQEFKLGTLEAPDLTAQNVVDVLLKWDGDYNSTSFITLKRFKQSQFDNSVNPSSSQRLVTKSEENSNEFQQDPGPDMNNN